MKLIRRVVSGDPIRVTRFHTESGEFVGWRRLIGLAPSVVSWGRYKLSGKGRLLPWWTWESIRFVADHLRSEDTVLEVGSGFSTIWFAERCAQVCSIEESPAWKQKVKAMLGMKGLNNVQLLEGDSGDQVEACLGRDSYDVVVIDGPKDRAAIFQSVLEVESTKRPRMIIYDDTDRSENRLDRLVDAMEYEVRRFRGFKPQTVHACETTVLLRRPT
jgi:predicted O-methyltransferase YrrM